MLNYSDIAQMDACHIGALMRKNPPCPVDLMEYTLEAIARYPDQNIFLSITAERARRLVLGSRRGDHRRVGALHDRDRHRRFDPDTGRVQRRRRLNDERGAHRDPRCFSTVAYTGYARPACQNGPRLHASQRAHPEEHGPRQCPQFLRGGIAKRARCRRNADEPADFGAGWT